MNTVSLLRALALLALLALTSPVSAATNVVLLGENLQGKIDAAAPGDTLVVQGGTYPGNLNFTKSLTVVRSGTNLLQFPGNTTILPFTTNVFSQVTLVGSLQVHSNSLLQLSKSICLTNVDINGARLEALDTTIGSINSTAAKLMLKRCTVSNACILTNTAVEALRFTNRQIFTAVAATNSGHTMVAVQSSFGTLTASNMSVLIGYSRVSPMLSLLDSSSTLIGCEVYSYEMNQTPAFNVYGGTFAALNSRFVRRYEGMLYASVSCGRMMLSAANFINCSIYCGGYYFATSRDHTTPTALHIQASSDAQMQVKNCAIEASEWNNHPNSRGIYVETGRLADLSYSCVGAVYPLLGVNSGTTLLSNPLLNADLTLATNSPCLNAGDPSAIANDRDGSRNDIGATGGPFWNPANYTNNTPMVFWLMASNQTVLKGLQATIPISAAASAGH